VPPRTDPRVKKIYVYSEGTFVLHNASEVHKLVIKTPAFDIAGWIDMSNMAPGGDTVFTEIRVSFANRSNILYRRTIFQSPQLITLGDITNGGRARLRATVSNGDGPTRATGGRSSFETRPAGAPQDDG
jgi:hypothetical protein